MIYQMQQVSLDPVLPASILFLTFLHTHKLISIPGHERLQDKGCEQITHVQWMYCIGL